VRTKAFCNKQLHGSVLPGAPDSHVFEQSDALLFHMRVVYADASTKDCA